MTTIQHGTINAYGYHSCRCKQCKRAWRIYYRAWIKEKLKDPQYRAHRQLQYRVAARKRKLARLETTESGLKEIYRKQRGRCAICGVKGEMRTGKPRRGVPGLHIDHCHNDRKVRGFLCHSCNLLLGHAKDNTEVLEQAIKYLKGEK